MKFSAASKIALAHLSALAIAGCNTGGLLGASSSHSFESRDARWAQRSSPTRAAASDAPSSGSGGSAERGFPASPGATAPSSDEEAPAESARVDRPGLGTEWGESRVSRVHDVPFSRDADRPFSIATVYYNDHAGVSAMSSLDQREGGAVDSAVPVRGGLTVSVFDESGSPLQSVSVGGRVYVVGEAGRRYSLVMRNHTGRRYEVVASVDGLDVVDGKTASLDKRGYVINPWGMLVVDGFRKSRDEVAAFRFGAVGESYAARTGSDRNVGVIGLALFAEAGSSPWGDEEIDRRRTAQPFSDARYAQPPPPM